MNNLIFTFTIAVICLLSIGAGKMRSGASVEGDAIDGPIISSDRIPHIGRVEVLNGCGISGAAGVVSGFLRDRSFDVRNSGNAENWNFPNTMVISRVEDCTVAEQISKVLGCDGVLLMRNNQELYDVTVIVGSDFSSLITGK